MDNDLLTVVIGWASVTVIGWYSPKPTVGTGVASETEVVKLLVWVYISGLISYVCPVWFCWLASFKILLISASLNGGISVCMVDDGGAVVKLGILSIWFVDDEILASFNNFWISACDNIDSLYWEVVCISAGLKAVFWIFGAVFDW